MAIDREANIRIKIAMTGGEAGTAAAALVTRMEAIDRRLGAISRGSPTGPAAFPDPTANRLGVPGAALSRGNPIGPAPSPDPTANRLGIGRPANPTGAAPGPIHVDPTPLPVKVANFADMNAAKPQAATVADTVRAGASTGFMGRIKSMFGLHMASGGVVPGTGVGDCVPALLEPGETVLPRSASGPGGLLAQMRQWAENRYGAKGLAGAMAFGSAASWGLSAGLTAAMGVPAILPPGIGPLLGLATAEARHRIKTPAMIERERREEEEQRAKRARSLARLAELPRFADYGASQYAAGGEVVRRYGSGGDDEPAYLTPGERVIPVSVARKHKPLLDWITGNNGQVGGPKHYAAGGIVNPHAARAAYRQGLSSQELLAEFISRSNPRQAEGTGARGAAAYGINSLSQYTVQDVRVINFMDMEKHMKGVGAAGGGGGGANVPGGAAGVGSYIRYAAVIGAMEQIATKAVNASQGLEIMNNSFMTTGQKTRSLFETFVPFGDKILALGDAIDGTNDKIRRSNMFRDRTINQQNARFQFERSSAGQEITRDHYRAQAFGANSVPLLRGRIFDTTTPFGEVQQHEEDARISARNALIRQTRQRNAAYEANRLQQERAEAHLAPANRARAAAERATLASRRAIERENRAGQASTGDRVTGYLGAAGVGALAGGAIGSVIPVVGTGLGAAAGAVGGLAGYGLYHAFGPDLPQRDRAGRQRAVNAEFMTGNARENAERALGQERVAAQRTLLALQREENETAKAQVGIRQTELQLMQERSNRMRQDMTRLGSLSRGEYRQAQRAAQLIHQGGQAAFERQSRQRVQMAALIDPRGIQAMQNILGNQRARGEAASNRVGELFQRDWQRGAASFGDTAAQERRLAQDIEQQLDAISRSSATNMSAAFENTMQMMVDTFTREMMSMQERFERNLRNALNERRG